MFCISVVGKLTWKLRSEIVRMHCIESIVNCMILVNDQWIDWKFSLNLQFRTWRQQQKIMILLKFHILINTIFANINRQKQSENKNKIWTRRKRREFNRISYCKKVVGMKQKNLTSCFLFSCFYIIMIRDPSFNMLITYELVYSFSVPF